MNQTLTPLCELALKYGTDKGGWHLRAGDTCHNYTPAYHEMFKDRREQIKRVLEIGVGGGASLRAWRDYFPNANIHGIDIREECLFKEERIDCLAANQYDRTHLAYAMAMWHRPQFDLIVDDGSHETGHQIFTANTLQQYLAADGLYVIEDIYEDCRPESVIEWINWGNWIAIPVGKGIGRAHCECGKCDEGEVLLVGRMSS